MPGGADVCGRRSPLLQRKIARSASPFCGKTLRGAAIHSSRAGAKKERGTPEGSFNRFGPTKRAGAHKQKKLPDRASAAAGACGDRRSHIARIIRKGSRRGRGFPVRQPAKPRSANKKAPGGSLRTFRRQTVEGTLLNVNRTWQLSILRRETHFSALQSIP